MKTESEYDAHCPHCCDGPGSISHEHGWCLHGPLATDTTETEPCDCGAVLRPGEPCCMAENQ